MESQKLYNALSDFVKDVCKDRDESHGHTHMKKVTDNAIYIYNKSDDIPKSIKTYNKILCVAFLHDVMDHKYDPKKTLNETINKFLDDVCTKFSIESPKDILQIIDYISYSKENKAMIANNPLKFIEILGDENAMIRDIVSDADKLEAIGKIGIIRCMEYTASVKQISYDEAFHNMECIKHVIDHADEKLLRLKDEFIRTRVGKLLAEPLHQEIIEELNKLKHIKLNDMSVYVPAIYGLNIEGGYPYQNMIKIHGNNIIWSNVIHVIDRPLVDKITFDKILEIARTNNYKIIEKVYDDFNEQTMFALYINIIVYYLAKYDGNIIVHIHQLQEYGYNIIENLKWYLNTFRTFILHKHPKINKKITMSRLIFISDVYTYLQSGPLIDEKYKDAKILLSFSQCAGFNKYHNPGTVYISDTFIPFDIKKNTINLNKKYNVENNFIKEINNILDNDVYDDIINCVNLISSENKVAHKLNENDFFKTSILQVNNLWNPDVEGDCIANIEF